MAERAPPDISHTCSELVSCNTSGRSSFIPEGYAVPGAALPRTGLGAGTASIVSGRTERIFFGDGTGFGLVPNILEGPLQKLDVKQEKIKSF